MDAELLRIVEHRLRDPGRDEEQWSGLVLAACDGADALEGALNGKSPALRERTSKPTEPNPEPPGAYLQSITVEGFRGIGPRNTLDIAAGPGLTLVIGRNGSGKSSFAEALEILLTGANWRWQYRSMIWKEGWRNLHHDSPTEVRAEFAVEGEKGAATVSRRWGEHAGLDESTIAVDVPSGRAADLVGLGWSNALESYRPFLSYNELGAMFDEGPTKLHDRLSRILGLGDLDHAEKLLREARLERESRVKLAKNALGALLFELAESGDERAAAAESLLSARKPDLAKVRDLISDDGPAAAAAPGLRVIRALAVLDVPSASAASAVAGRLRSAVKRASALSATDARRTSDVAELLRRALEFHESHGDGDCPVCGNSKAISSTWRRQASARLEEIRVRNKRWEAIAIETKAALADANGLLAKPPGFLWSAGEVGIDTSALTEAWATLMAKPDSSDLAALADHLERSVAGLEVAADTVRTQAAQELDRREDAWRPIAIRIAAWLVQTEKARVDEACIAQLKAAEKWLKEAAADIRAERFEPIAAQAIANWQELRQQSSVEVGRIALEGTGTKRRVRVDVQIDGVGGAALGVMSQGELHAIALAMFLPRATLPESPFRFVVIDDPVQSMDPARVDGLAHVLARTAGTRQVLVFTHDDRLPESLRRLALDARIIEVTRHENSAIELRESLDPVERNLDDAGALVTTKSLPIEVAREVVPAFCRSAIEAAAIQVVRRRRIGRGEAHYAVERLLAEAKTTLNLLSLAMWDDAARGGEAIRSVSQRWGEELGDALGTAVRGAHAGYGGSLEALVRNTRRLCGKIVELRP